MNNGIMKQYLLAFALTFCLFAMPSCSNSKIDKAKLEQEIKDSILHAQGTEQSSDQVSIHSPVSARSLWRT